MIELDLKFTNFDGVEVTENWAFHMSLVKIAELESNGGFEHRYRQALANKDGMAVLALLQELMNASVGKRSEDRRRFIQNDEISTEFVETGAYDALFTQLATGEISPAKFFNGVMPSGLEEKAQKMKDTIALADGVANVSLDAVEPRGYIKKLEDYTEQELLEMPNEEFTALVKLYKNNIPQKLLVIGMQRTTRG